MNSFWGTTSHEVISQMTSCLSHADTNINARVNNKRKCFYKNLQFEIAQIDNASHVNQTVQLHGPTFASQLTPVTRAKTGKASQCVRVLLVWFQCSSYEPSQKLEELVTLLHNQNVDSSANQHVQNCIPII